MGEIIMPKMGDAMESGVIVQWLKQVGDTVQIDDPVFEIETDKSNVEVTADAAGILQEQRYAAGANVPVGTIVAVVGQGLATTGAAIATPVTAEIAAKSDNGREPAPAPLPLPLPLASGEYRPYGDSFVGRLPENFGGSASLLGQPVEALRAVAEHDRIKASPLARAIAAANGVRLESLGVAGVVNAADVQAALALPQAPAAAVESPAVDVQEYNAMRRTIARRLSDSKSTIPHFYVTVEIDMEALLTLRTSLNDGLADDARVSVNDCLLKAVSVALAENPRINSRFEENRRLVSRAHHLGFGVSVADGLIVPVVRHCEAKSLRQIAAETKPLIERARAGKLAPADYTGGTFTISNLGSMADVENFAAIINPGEGAILAVAGTRSVAAVVGGQVVARRRMKVTLSADHRVIDGADGATFLLSLKRVLENPLQMLS